MRLNQAGWKSVALELCFAEHLCHKPKIRNRGMLSPSHQKDMNTFKRNIRIGKRIILLLEKVVNVDKSAFLLHAFSNVFYGYLLRLYDRYYTRKDCL